MTKPAILDRQIEKDRKQVRQHYVHWGVKTIATLVFAAIAGALWLGWISLTGTSR